MQACVSADERFNHILSKVEAKKIPLWSHLDLTYKCNQKCLHCYCQGLSSNFSAYQAELSTSEIYGLLDQLKSIGALYLTLSGGEVFLREDFFDIAFYAKKNNFLLKVFTNGTLINQAKAAQLVKLFPFSVEMSIYGATSDVHDAITRLSGSFDKLIEAVHLLKKNNLRVELKSALMKENFHQAQDIEELCRKLKADNYRWTIEISPKNDGNRLPQEHQLNKQELLSVLSNSSDMAVGERHTVPLQLPQNKPLCGTGTIGCYISPHGDVYPCIQLLIPMGNIREKSFQEIWSAPSPLRQQLDVLKTYSDLPLCRSCQYVRICKKCIGLAYLETKDFSGCYETLKNISQIEMELAGG